jgi:4-amino-4-deoxy-L-arabinose transferase-like glycosyltransferase
MPLSPFRRSATVVSAAIVFAWCVGILGRGYWTPDEPREADIAWRMSWQSDKAVPLLAGEAFCEKPPFAYWAAGAAMRLFGVSAWAARLPNLAYALIAAMAALLLARRSAGPLAGVVAAAALGTFLLSYQVEIWLATDAPLLAATSVALLGAYGGFYAAHRAGRLRNYTLMHAALAVGFLSKSAVAFMVPALAILSLAIWERRLRELLRWELYAGLLLEAIAILGWVGFVYAGTDGAQHLKIFFWNNLAGRFAQVDAPQGLQYAAAHRNTPGKYFIELPVYLWPWTLLVAAALRRAWLERLTLLQRPASLERGAMVERGPGLERRAAFDDGRAVRFALASALPALLLLSVAATARNIYLAPALPGFALLLGWWGRETLRARDLWDRRAVRATAALLLVAVLVSAAGVAIAGMDARDGMSAPWVFIAVSALILAALLALEAARAADPRRSLFALVLAYSVLLTGPAAALYRIVDTWQNLPAIGRAIGADAAGRPLILMAPDETTRAFIDMYSSPRVELIRAPFDAASVPALQAAMRNEPRAMVVAQLPGREESRLLRRFALVRRLAPRTNEALPAWISAAGLRIVHRYALPNGRRYALLEALDRG